MIESNIKYLNGRTDLIKERIGRIVLSAKIIDDKDKKDILEKCMELVENIKDNPKIICKTLRGIVCSILYISFMINRKKISQAETANLYYEIIQEEEPSEMTIQGIKKLILTELNMNIPQVKRKLFFNRGKKEIINFRIGEKDRELMKEIANKSDFIRKAIKEKLEREKHEV